MMGGLPQRAFWLRSRGALNRSVQASSDQFVRRRLEAQSLPGSQVELQSDGIQLRLGVSGQIGSLGEVLSQQPVGVLVRATLPGTVRIAEVDLHVGGDGEVLVVRPSPCPDPKSAIGAAAAAAGARVRARARTTVWLSLARHLHQHHEPRLAFDQRGDVSVVGSGQQVSLPVTWNGSILGLRRSLADGDRVQDLARVRDP